MKILITGSKGQLGNELQEIIKIGKAEIGQVSEVIKKSEVIAFDLDELDMLNLQQTKMKINSLKPDVIINRAATTNAEYCEINEEFALKVNSIGPRNLAIASAEIGAKLVQVSTDYVFSGASNKPLMEYDFAAPCNVYGKTKL